MYDSEIWYSNRSSENVHVSLRLYIMKNVIPAVQNHYFAFSSLVIINEPLKLGLWKFMWRKLIFAFKFSMKCFSCFIYTYSNIQYIHMRVLFLRLKWLGVELTTHLHIVQRLRMHESLPVLHYTYAWCVA
jgi:hypothetical protein